MHRSVRRRSLQIFSSMLCNLILFVFKLKYNFWIVDVSFWNDQNCKNVQIDVEKYIKYPKYGTRCNSREEFLLKFYIIVAAAEFIFSLVE